MHPRLDKINSRIRIGSVWKEQLFAIDLVISDGLLTLGRYQPIDERLSEVPLHFWMLLRVHQYHAGLVEHAFIAFHQYLQVTLALEVNPGAAVGQHIAVAGGRLVKRCVHALADRCVPGAPLVLDVDPGVLVPERELGKMSAGAVAARYERRVFVLYGLKRFRDIVHALDAGGIANQHKVVVHHRKSLHAFSLGYES